MKRILQNKPDNRESIKRIKSNFIYDDENNENEDKENINKENRNEENVAYKPMKLSIMIPTKPNIKTIPLPPPIDIDDDGYETDETIGEEKYISNHEYKAPEKSSYQRYLEMTDVSRRNIPDGYETDDTDIEGGRRTRRVKRTHMKKHRKATQKQGKKSRRTKGTITRTRTMRHGRTHMKHGRTHMKHRK
jgi:hypothetical protein